MAIRHNILVLDSPQAEVRAAEQIARDLGHVVFTHASPVGVGGVLSRFEIDTVMFGWALSTEQDAKLQALLESWERARSLRVIILVEKRRSELVTQLSAHPDASVVTFEEIASRLPDLLGQTSREMNVAPSSSTPPAVQFVERLRSRLQAASNVWEKIAQGTATYGDMNFPLAAAQGQAELLAFRKVTELLHEVAQVVTSSKSAGGRPSPQQYDAVTAALRFSIHATTAPPYDSDRDTSPLVRRLRRSRA